MTEGGNAMDRYIRVLATMAIVLLTFGMEVGAAEVSYISGGIGADMREELLAKEKEYNLKIVVAEKSGDYLAGVQIVIESDKKEQVLDTTMEGPILLARLAPGTYTIRATSDGRPLSRTVTIPAQGLRQVDFRWAVSK
jgi:putative lipoic acid-binding regulatory protein